MTPAELVKRTLPEVQHLSVGSGYAEDEVEQAASHLRDLGIDVLGTGAYSLVMALPNDDAKVVKLTFSPEDGYHDFVEFVQQAAEFMPEHLLQHLPRIYSSRVIGGMRVTVLERLSYGAWDLNEESTDTYGIVKDGVREAMPSHRVFDLHSRNTMFRGNVRVIADPWSHNADHDWNTDYDDEDAEETL